MVDQETMEEVGAGRPDERLGRHEDALRRERKLLSDCTDRHGTVRFDGAAEIALDEFTGNV